MRDPRFIVLDAAKADGRAEWTRRWRAWPEQEPMAHPAYASLFARAGDRALCLASGDDAAGVLYPLILRPLATEPWASAAEGSWDAVTPYGYGGPFAWGSPPPAAEPFWEAAEAWLLGAKVVTSFARLSLFPEEMIAFRGEVAELMPNVVRELKLDADALWMDYAHKVRKNVNAARRAGLTFEVDEEGRRLEEFLTIYESTMDRRNAGEGYYFPRTFFETIVRELPRGFLFAHVLDAGRVVSTELVLRSGSHLYSFLGGTLADAFEKRPNDLLKHEVAEWGRREGYGAYVLGGGYGGPDGIFKYKLSFAPGGEVAFRVGRAVHDPPAVAALLEQRRAFEAARGTPWAPAPTFFPPYRA